jgi:hypothetical protein
VEFEADADLVASGGSGGGRGGIVGREGLVVPEVDVSLEQRPGGSHGGGDERRFRSTRSSYILLMLEFELLTAAFYRIC